MLRTVLVFAIALSLSNTSQAQDDHDEIYVGATVEAIVPLADFSGSVIPVDPDPRFAMTLHIESVAPHVTNFSSGASITFGIHSPSLLFAGEPTKDAIYQFSLRHELRDGESEFSLTTVVAPSSTDKPAAALRCELQLSRGDTLTTDSQSHFHFLLFSERNGLKVYDEWNMWGYFARTFDLTVAGTKNYQVTRRDRIWDKYFPKSVTIDRGEVLATDIYLCDGSWSVSPKLPVQTVSVNMIGRYTLRPRTGPAASSSFFPLEDIWIGTINSPPVELNLSKGCVLRLDSERPQY
jgi:hypothetical protein